MALEKFLLDAETREEVRAAWNLGKLESKHVVFVAGTESESPSIFHNGVFYGINMAELDPEAFHNALVAAMADPQYLPTQKRNGFITYTATVKLNSIAYGATRVLRSDVDTWMQTDLTSILTKAMVENVLTGNIRTHYHSQYQPLEPIVISANEQSNYTKIQGALSEDLLRIETQEDVVKIETTKAKSVIFEEGEFIIDNIKVSPFVRSIEGVKHKTTLILKTSKETAFTGQGQSLKDLYILAVNTRGAKRALKGFGGCINQIEDVKFYVKNEDTSKFIVCENCENFHNVAFLASENSKLQAVATNVTAIKDSIRVNSISFRGLFGTYLDECEIVSDCYFNAEINSSSEIKSVIFNKSQVSNCFIKIDATIPEHSYITQSGGDSLIANTISRININWIPQS